MNMIAIPDEKDVIFSSGIYHFSLCGIGVDDRRAFYAWYACLHVTNARLFIRGDAYPFTEPYTRLKSCFAAGKYFRSDPGGVVFD